jgi:hypothetical protein
MPARREPCGYDSSCVSHPAAEHSRHLGLRQQRVEIRHEQTCSAIAGGRSTGAVTSVRPGNGAVPLVRLGRTMMRPRSWVWFPVLMTTTALTGVHPARAQMPGMQHGGRRGGQQHGESSSPAPPPPALTPEIWPRLDPGAVICASSRDLLRYQLGMEGSQPVASGGTQPNCRRVTVATPIRIVGHDGPSRTQVVATGADKRTGWTNAYLPDKPPATGAR